MTAHDPITGKVLEPCPMCGSVNVRWRDRRWYDIVRTHVWWFFDRTLGRFFGSSETTVTGSMLSEPSARVIVDSIRYDETRRFYEDRVGTMTARRFWKCGKCHRRGQVLADTSRILEDRERILGIQDRIENERAVINSRIDRRPPP